MNDVYKDSPKVLVCQHGARHRYAIPSLLNKSGMLAALYTDSSVYSRLGAMAQFANRCGITHSKVKALASRIPQGLSRKKIFSSDRPFHAALSRGALPGDMSPIYRQWGLQDANVVYSMYGEDLAFLEWASSQGAKIIIDVFVHPETNQITAREEELYGFSSGSKLIMADEINHSRRVFELADLLLCPSEWVAGGVRAFMPECQDKIRIVQYGSSVHAVGGINSPKVGNILFAGREPLRKGLHYLADAAHRLREEGLQIDVHVAGVDESEIGWIEHRAELNCLGTIPMARMKKEYAKADVFVLPSLSEGQAGVVLEAMASGVPVVATKESGVDFDPGCGLTVPAKDPEALAAGIRQVINDRAYRTKLAEGALRQAKMFSMDEWERRLVHVITELV